MANASSVWNPENIRDVAESTGLAALPTDVVDHLTRDVEFRIAQIIEEAMKSMRHAKRTTLMTSDISQALRILDIEPLYGYESTRPLKFGEASIGPGQPLFYLEDEEVDFEKLINAPLPKVPREMCFTAHWLAVEGVQPSIAQNPTPADTSRQTEQGLSLLPKGSGPNAANANAVLAATAGADNVAVKPPVKHILSKELQQYFEHVCSALLDETSSDDAYRLAALSSVRTDPGLHQLVPYFVQFVAEKVTHGLKNLFILTQMLHLISALVDNPNIHITPYVASLVPPVLTCLVGKRLGPAASSTAPSSDSDQKSHSLLPPHYELRQLASSVLQSLTRPTFTAATPTLKPRLARTLLKYLLSPTTQPLGCYYGTILGLTHITGAEGVRVLIVPNLKALDNVLQGVGDNVRELDKEGKTDAAQSKEREADEVVSAILNALSMLEKEDPAINSALNHSESAMDMGEDENSRSKLIDKFGEVIGGRIADLGRRQLIKLALGVSIQQS